METLRSSQDIGPVSPTACAISTEVPSHDERRNFTFVAIPVVIGLGLNEFVPSHNVFVVLLLEINREFVYQPRLQFTNAIEVIVLDAFLTKGIFLPSVGGTFVTTKVDVASREYFRHIVEHCLEEVDDFIVTDVQHVFGDTGSHTNIVGAIRVAAQLWIGSKRSHHVSRHVDFGDDFDVSFGSISHNLAQVVEGVVHATTIFRVVKELWVSTIAHKRTLTTASHLGELGIFGNLDAPTLVVGQVPVQTVHFVERHDVEDALHLIFVEEVTSNVEHISAIRQEGFVLDAKHGEIPVSLCHILGIESLGHELTQSLQTIEKTSTMSGFDFDVLFGDV